MWNIQTQGVLSRLLYDFYVGFVSMRVPGLTWFRIIKRNPRSEVWGFGIPKVIKMKSHDLRLAILLTRPKDAKDKIQGLT